MSRPAARTDEQVVGLGALTGGLLGGVAGGVLGLFAYPPTAWFAVIELGVPGAVLGALFALAVVALRRRAPDRRPP